ncbi:MAG: amino acid adenylation domain-containing protein [Oscillospiraceae bacterium]|nr:amino acid adenylation domain-containing protein [Oscillospiraceae bacterium]
MKNILEFLENTAPKLGDKPAFADESGSLSFAELLRLARAGGSFLAERGIYRQPVVVFMDKAPRTIAAFFAVMYAGCCYVPLEKGMPLHRLRMILQRLQPQAIVCDEESAALAAELGAGDKVIDSSELFAAETDDASLAAIRRRHIDTDPAYIVFTSGSTGVPKGVTACHRSVIDYANALCPVIGASEDSRFAMQVPLYVDACMKEILSVIKCGSTAFLMPQSLFMSPLRVLDFLNRYEINTICWVASALTLVSGLGAFEEGRPEHMKTVCFGSEVFPVKQLHLWQSACPEARFINLYGPTEATGMSFYFNVDRDFAEGEAIPVGRPFYNTDFILLREDDTEAPAGEPGEICIRGTALSLGYFDDPERTAAAFTQNPLNPHYPETVYRTGDIGRLNERGELVFISRKDSQIKNMGHRIELGEIESCACLCGGVESACCLFEKEKSKLYLYYMGTADEKSVQKHLRKELPRYMVPTKLYRMQTLPLLPNGKIDRKSLIDMER